MRRAFLRSRNGNLVLAVVGAVYTVASLAVLVWFVADVWGAAGMTDRVLQLALIASGLCGYWFLRSALDNLGAKSDDRERQSAAAVSNPASIQR